MTARLSAFILSIGIAASIGAQAVDPSILQDLRWRLVGPFRGGRSLAVCGVTGQPEKFYFGAVGGGVWVTENAGRTWTPVFDHEPMASIGAIAVAHSAPNVVYVGTGEADMRSDIQQGNGMYRSGDGGRSWTHIGLDDSRQIGKILIDPSNPDIVYVAALGHQYGPNSQRGVFKTSDGGKSWSKVLSKDQNTGAIDLDMDPSDSNVIFASLWQTRRPPWSVYPPSNGPGSGLYKSSDGGATWTQIKGSGLPEQVGRIGISISPANHDRVFLCVDAKDPKRGGVYRSDDGGATWTHTSDDPRIWGRGWYFMGITADPKNPDEVYVMNTSAYRSVDGGKTFVAFKGAPGGDDYHTCWIAPDDSSRMILASDQGTIVSVDGGRTWSSWYNQPTGQFYHVVTDNRFPYWIYGSQQDSGAMAIPSRTIHTGISALYQRPIDAGGESGTIAPDPMHPGLLFSSGGSKEDLETGWEQNIDPTLSRPATVWRSEWTQPITISPANRRVVYTSHQKIFRSGDGGASWKVISPDLTRNALNTPKNLDGPTAADNDGERSHGVVYWIAPSPLQARQIWAGTDDGLIWLTLDDGVRWRNVTPPTLDPWSKVGVIDASHFSAGTAYAAIDRHRLDDNHPYIYRTRDLGRHWKLIVNGLPSNQFVNVVREDPHEPGLLYAGTDWGVFVSFDGGDRWQSLQANLPPASVRDIVFGGDDVVIGTHGRANWILDDVAVLRGIASGHRKGLLPPSAAILFQRAGTFGFGAFDEGTPLPPEEPQGQNRPWGAILDYVIPAGVHGPVVLSIYDSKGNRVRRISSLDAPRTIDPASLSIPAYWLRSPQVLSASPGGHRYVWDLRYGSANGPLLPPDRYIARLSVSGKTYEQALPIQRDPRIHATDRDLRLQFDLARTIRKEIEKLQALQSTANARLKGLAGPSKGQLQRLIDGSGLETLASIQSGFAALEGAVESAPAAPTLEYRRAFADLRRREAHVGRAMKRSSL